MTSRHRTDLVLDLAREVGFARVGIAAAGLMSRVDYLDDWLARGCNGEMAYLARHRTLRGDLRELFPGARTIIVVADHYNQPEENWGSPAGGGGCGRIARYAWGRDYHHVLRKKLHRFTDRLREVVGEPFEARACVDTAPVVEREWAARAGVGWIGKNTMVLNESLGSFFFLGEILTTLELIPSSPVTDRCGSCTRCLQACPTGALVAPYQMDARRCISYLTIEHAGEIDAELQPLMRDWLYGCDICQDVCPYNRKAPVTNEPAYLAGGRNPLPPLASLSVLENWRQEDYDHNLAGSAMRRARLDMLKRNAAIVERNAKRCPGNEL